MNEQEPEFGFGSSNLTITALYGRS